MARVLHPLALALSVILLACAARRSHAGFWSDLFGKQPCPPSGFNAIQGFDVSAYAAAPWYPQKQVTRPAAVSAPAAYLHRPQSMEVTSALFAHCACRSP